jgi:hypothetical protein
VALGPQQMPPQGARALVGALLGGERVGLAVSAVLDESQPGVPSIEFVNEGAGTAVGLQYVVEAPGGALTPHAVGDLAPGATLSTPLRSPPSEPFRCVWLCQDFKGRACAWGYDGRSKRLRGARVADAEAAFRSLYG